MLVCFLLGVCAKKLSTCRKKKKIIPVWPDKPKITSEDNAVDQTIMSINSLNFDNHERINSFGIASDYSGQMCMSDLRLVINQTTNVNDVNSAHLRCTSHTELVTPM